MMVKRLVGPRIVKVEDCQRLENEHHHPLQIDQEQFLALLEWLKPCKTNCFKVSLLSATDPKS